MKKLISIIVLLAMLVCAIIMAVPAGADETENDPSVNPDIQYFVFPHPFLEGSIDGAHLNKEEYLELLKENIPAIGEINLEFYEEFPEFLWPDYMTEFDREHLENSYTGFPIPSYPEESLDYSNHKDKDRCYIVSCKDGFFVILYTS
ncbi:MAG: hypothetical protein IKI91_02525, partial [Clostridia bacterium]|nr:hypothetical protein [Clostridia bacterium]